MITNINKPTVLYLLLFLLIGILNPIGSELKATSSEDDCLKCSTAFCTLRWESGKNPGPTPIIEGAPSWVQESFGPNPDKSFYYSMVKILDKDQEWSALSKKYKINNRDQTIGLIVLGATIISPEKSLIKLAKTILPSGWFVQKSLKEREVLEKESARIINKNVTKAMKDAGVCFRISN